MKILTLAFLFRDGKILLPMKKEGFGAGKWNGYGGKVKEGESALEAIVRETEEESGLRIKKELFKELGNLDFYFDDKPEWNQKVPVYRVDDFEGEPVETVEMKPKWFELSKIPWDEMWKGDDQFIPLVIENKKFKGEIHFGEQGERLVSVCIETY